jgi:hypothetical protein
MSLIATTTLGIYSKGTVIEATNNSYPAPVLGNYCGAVIGATYHPIVPYGDLDSTYLPYQFINGYRGAIVFYIRATLTVATTVLWSFTPPNNSAWLCKYSAVTGGAAPGGTSRGGIYEGAQYIYNRSGVLAYGVLANYTAGTTGNPAMVSSASVFNLQWGNYSNTSGSQSLSMRVEMISCDQFL